MTATREIPRDIVDTVHTARTLERDGRDQIQRSADMIRDTARHLAGQGWTQADIAVALGCQQAAGVPAGQPPQAGNQGVTPGGISPRGRPPLPPPPEKNDPL
jgi:hypothetical protein